jgi:hypothetical protein
MLDDGAGMVYVGKSAGGEKLHIARFPWKHGPAWCGVQITGKIRFKLNAEDPDVCRLCIKAIDSHLTAKYKKSSRG